MPCSQSTPASATTARGEAWFRSLDRPQLRPPQLRLLPRDVRPSPINAIGAMIVAEVDLIDHDTDLSVVVFGSANPDFYLGHYGWEDDPRRAGAIASRARGAASMDGRPWGPGSRSEGQRRLDSRTHGRRRKRVRARPRPAGSPHARTRCSPSSRFAAACARRGARWPGFHTSSAVAGPSRSSSSGMISTGRRVEEDGYLDRLIADDQLDGEVDRIASRVGRLDGDAFSRAKSYFEQATLPEA